MVKRYKNNPPVFSFNLLTHVTHKLEIKIFCHSEFNSESA